MNAMFPWKTSFEGWGRWLSQYNACCAGVRAEPGSPCLSKYVVACACKPGAGRQRQEDPGDLLLTSDPHVHLLLHTNVLLHMHEQAHTYWHIHTQIF